MLVLVFLDMILLAFYVLVEGHDLSHINDHKQVIMFILGVVSGWLGKEHINKKT